MSIDGVKIRFGAGFDDVGARTFPWGEASVSEVHFQGDFAQRVHSLSDGSQGIIHELAFCVCEPVDGFERGVDRPVPDAGILEAAIRFGGGSRGCGKSQTNSRGGNRGVSGGNADIIKGPRFGDFGDVAFDKGYQIIVVDKLLLIPNLLEASKNGGGILLGHFETFFLEASSNGRAAAVFGERKLSFTPPDNLWVHDFVGIPVLEHAVLVNAAGVSEGVFTDNGLVALDQESAHARYKPGGFDNFTRLDAAFDVAEVVCPCLESHHQFLKGRIPGPFTDAVDGAFDLSGAGLDSREGICDGQSEIVVAMDADNCLTRTELGNFGVEIFDKRSVVLGHGPTDGVRDVDRGSTGVNDGPADLDEEIGLRSRGVFRGKLDIVDEGSSAVDTLDSESDDLVFGLLELEFPVNLRGGEEDVDASAFAGGFHCFASGVDVFGDAPRKTCDNGAFDLPGDRLHGCEVAFADHGEARFNDIHLEPRKLPGDFKFFAEVHRCAGALLAVAEGGVENAESIFIHRPG